VTATSSTTVDRARPFLELHRPGTPLVMPNAWDLGSAKLFVSLGFEAIATTSSGFAATLGRLDGAVSRDEAIAHTAALAGGVDVPVNADLEDGFGDDPSTAAETIRLAVEAGAAGASIEDYTRDDDAPIHELGLAVERIAAAAEVSRREGSRIALTARAENLIHGVDDLADTIRRLQAYQEAGADVLYAPGLSDLDQIRSLVTSVDRPVNVLLRPGGPDVGALADVGVARISVGGALAWVAFGAVAAAAEELRAGTHGYETLAAAGVRAARVALR